MKTLTVIFALIGLFISCNNNITIKNNNKLTKNIDTMITFENENIDEVPSRFFMSNTGTLQTNNWTIVSDNNNKVVAQLAKNSGSYYNILILDKFGYKNFKMSVKIKAVSGDEDQGGGLVWRYIDNNNYYIARYNPLENNLRFYKVSNGNRKQLESIESNIKSGEWFTMTIEMNENKIICSLNGQELIQTQDDTFKDVGNIGFWTKADAVTYFDELNIKEIK